MRRKPITDERPGAIYRDITVTYDESDDLWKFTLRGVDRSARTLANAKKAIDAPEPKNKRRFEECFAYYKRNYASELPEKVRVTGLAERGRYASQQQVWIVEVADKNSRRKVGVDDLIAASPKNVKLAAEWQELEKQTEVLHVKQRSIEARYEKFRLPDDIEDGQEEETK